MVEAGHDCLLTSCSHVQDDGSGKGKLGGGSVWGCCKMLLDFGEVAAGEQLETAFYVTNTGECSVYVCMRAR